MRKLDPPDPKKHIPMHPLEFQSLLVLMEEPLHGYGIAKAIEARGGGSGKVLPTNLYRRLRDLAEKGLVAESEDADGTRKRIFSITGFGRAVARAEAERLETLVGYARGHNLLPSRTGEG